MHAQCKSLMFGLTKWEGGLWFPCRMCGMCSINLLAQGVCLPTCSNIHSMTCTHINTHYKR